MGFPKLVDHINGIKHDNRMCNLREVTEVQSQMNRGLRKTNKSGVIGVSWSAKKSRWMAELRVNRKRVHRSYHNTIEEASASRAKAVADHFGEFSPVMISINNGKLDNIHRELYETGGAVGEWENGVPVFGMWKI